VQDGSKNLKSNIFEPNKMIKIILTVVVILTNTSACWAFSSIKEIPVSSGYQRISYPKNMRIATCCDLIVMAEDAMIGYPPARVFGCPSVGMWVFRIGAQLAKRLLFTGDLIDGKTAKNYGLALEAVPASDLDETVQKLAERIAGVPKNQLMMHKLMINSAIENMGLASTQQMATFFDGITRHSPEGVWWKERAEEVGFKQAVKERDAGLPIAPDAEKHLPPDTKD
jgi:enoyl-CoA hydratase